MDFYHATPSLETYWRSIILFGRNSASYKFALAKSLIDLAGNQNDLITLEQLAQPFSKHLCEHLKLSEKQGNRQGSRFLDACRQFNAGELSDDALVIATQKLGFVNVIDAFHNVNQGEIPQRFFIDERKQSGGIRVTEALFELFSDDGSRSLYDETESRWRLVETAWDLKLSRNLIVVHSDLESERLFANLSNRRVDITSSRGGLNGYQKGRCFYCYDHISIEPGSADLADVDHFFPHVLKQSRQLLNLDGVWNLVLACQSCNRGHDGKFAKVPSTTLLTRLHKRNEYLITSHHPLRETLIRQSGVSEPVRRNFLQQCYTHAIDTLIHTWEPEPKGLADL